MRSLPRRIIAAGKCYGESFTKKNPKTKKTNDILELRNLYSGAKAIGRFSGLPNVSKYFSQIFQIFFRFWYCVNVCNIVHFHYRNDAGGRKQMNATSSKVVLVTGPFDDFDIRGNECFYWEVMVTDECGTIYSKVYKVFCKNRAIALGDKMGADRGLDVEVDCA